MKTPRFSRRKRALLNCAPVGEECIRDRSMRSAVLRASDSNEFANQQSFDRAVAALVRIIPIPPATAEWFSTKDLFSPSKWTWKKTLRNPAVIAVGIALVVIAGVLIFQFIARLNDFPGSATARKLLTIAGSTRSVLLDPVNADAGTLSDLFFMKHGLEHYDVITTCPRSLPIFTRLAAAFSRTISHNASPKSGWPRNVCSSFSFQRRGTSSRGPCYGFPRGGMFIKKAGLGLLWSITGCVSWPRCVAVKKSSPRTFRGRNSKLKFVDMPRRAIESFRRDARVAQR